MTLARLQGLAPVVSHETRLLVLGSFPGVASLRAQQYYGHPRNHFWPVVASILDIDLLAMDYPERLAAVLRRGLGIWDVYVSCEREGSLDQAIRRPLHNDFQALRRQAPKLRHVAHNGGESARARRHLQALGFEVYTLPSTSPANASWSFDRKLAAWRSVFAVAGI